MREASATGFPDAWNGMDGLLCGFGSRTLQAPGQTRLLRKQVHGNVVVDAAVDVSELRPDASDDYLRVQADADALVASRPGLVVGVRTADCVPLLLVAPQSGWAAAVHAGWRGTIAEIAAQAVKVANAVGIRPQELHAALGPSIGPCCYEVSFELGDEFERADLPVLRRDGAKPHLDLRAANRRILEKAGVSAANICDVGPCTRCASDAYHSFRAEPESAGRQVSWIGWEDRTQSPDRGPRR